MSDLPTSHENTESMVIGSDDDTPLKRRIDDAMQDTEASRPYDSNKAGKLIETGIWKRHQGSYPPAQYPNHYGGAMK